MNMQKKYEVFTNLSWQIKPKTSFYPYGRCKHSAALVNDKMYIFGGINQKSDVAEPKNTTQPFYQINCTTFSSRMLYNKKNDIVKRESSSCNVINKQIIIWGGQKNNKVTNQGIKVVSKNQFYFWDQIYQVPKPKERKNHASTVVNNKLILIYGGINENQQILDDCWVFNANNNIWFPVHIHQQSERIVGCTLTTFNDNTIYMFGGQYPNKKHISSLFKIVIPAETQFTNVFENQNIKAESIQPQGQPPKGRSFHGAVNVFDRYLIIIGGEYLVLSDGRQKMCLLGDIWTYDIMKNQWIEIKTTNPECFKPKSHFSVVNHENDIIIFGGLLSKETIRCSNQLLVLPLKSHKVIKQKQPLKDKKGRINLIHEICKIIDYFYKLGYEKVQINVSNSILSVEGKGIKLKQQQFKKLRRNRFSKNKHQLRQNCQNIGDSILLVNFDQPLTYLLHLSKNNEYYAQFDVQNSSVQKVYEKSYEIISNYIIDHGINLKLKQQNNLTIIITNSLQLSILSFIESCIYFEDQEMSETIRKFLEEKQIPIHIQINGRMI